jgi:hypothetical protein
VGLLDDLNNYHSESINIPGIGKLPGSATLYISSSDGAKSAVGTGCPVFVPFVRN